MCKDIARSSHRGGLSLFRYLVSVMFLLALVACGGGLEELKLAPERPRGNVEGELRIGELTNSSVTAYSFDNLEDRVFLAKTEVDAEGRFALNVKAPSQIILLELEAESYLEPAGNTSVIPATGTKLTALMNYVSGQQHFVTITPFTHLSAGLADNYRRTGLSASEAYTRSNDEFELLYGIAFNSTLPVSEQSLVEGKQESDDEVLYGLVVAGLSELSKTISLASEPNLHETINSWSLSDLLAKDIGADGVLDGVTQQQVTQEKSNLMLGNVVLDASILQQKLAAASLNTELYEKVKAQTDTNTVEEFVMRFSSRASAVLNSNDSNPLNSPVVSLAEPLLGHYAGDVQVSTEVNGILKLNSLKFFIDNDLIENSIEDPLRSQKIDSRLYSDGKHTLTIIAVDEFGNEGSALFEIVFDNTSPSIEILSSLKTNQGLYRLQGSYQDTGSGIKAVTVNASNAVMDAENSSWFFDIELTEGRNAVVVNVSDRLDNQRSTEVEVILDTLAPVIDSSGKNSEATFVIENGNYLLDDLKEINSFPVYLSVDKLSLQGETVSSSILQTKKIPYFSFTVIDPVSAGHASAFSGLDLKIRVEKNSEVIRDWFEITAENEQYYLPLVRETMGADIDSAKVSDKFVIRARAVDEAGNEVQQKFEFSAALFVPDQQTSLLNTELGKMWRSVDFAHRTSLYDRELVALEFEYINTSPANVYIKPKEAGSNKVVQVYEQVNRENKVRLRAQAYWRVGKVDNPRKTCPEFNGSWQPVNQIFNYTENNVWKEERPGITVSDPIAIEQDVMVPKPDSPWNSLPNFDDTHELVEIHSDAGDILSYSHDYVLDIGITGMSQPAMISNWQYYTAADKKTVICKDVRNFQYMEKYEYLIEPGYPRNIVLEKNVEIAFETSKFKVFDEDGSELIANNGWFKVPVSHKVKIQKIVSTPLLTSHTDTSVSTPDSISEYAPQTLDLSFTWVLSQSLGLDFTTDIDNKLNDVVVSRQQEFHNDLSYYTLHRD